MVLKWALVAFGVTAVVLFLLSKVLAFLNPPRPGRPADPSYGMPGRVLEARLARTRALAALQYV